MLTASERTATLLSVVQTGVEAGLKRMRCACPGIVQSWDAVHQTVSVKLALKEVMAIEGERSEIEIPMLVDVPVVMPRAGGYCLLMTPKFGDECLVVFSDMCIDAWYQSGGIQSQAEFRRHDLSDGFAILGCWSQVRKPEYPTSGLRLQNDEGTAYVAIDESGVHFANADFNIRDLETSNYGVAVGTSPTGTASDKKFEVASDHTAHFYGDTQFAQGKTVTFNGNVSFSGIDSGWATPTLENCTEYDTGYEVRIRRIGDMVYLRGAVKLNAKLDSGSAGSSAGVVEIMQLSNDFKPLWPLEFPVIPERAQVYLHFGLDTDGKLKLYNRCGNRVETTTLIPLSMSYLRG